jgi:hypothetical protein
MLQFSQNERPDRVRSEAFESAAPLLFGTPNMTAPERKETSMGTDSAPPSQEFVETAWRLRGPLGSVVTCVILPNGTAFTLCVLQGPSKVSRTHTVLSLRRARLKAEEWRTTLLSLSEFEEFKGEGDPSPTLGDDLRSQWAPSSRSAPDTRGEVSGRHPMDSTR